MAKNAGQRILEVAEELFLKYGWQRITVDEICRKTGVTRKTFYTYYSNKDEVVILVLNIFTEKMIEMFSKIFNNQDINLAEKLKQTLILKLELAQTMSIEFIEDYILSDDEKVIDIREKKENLSNGLLVNEFEKAKKNGEIREDVNINVLLAIVEQLKPLYLQPEFLANFRNMSDMIEQVSNMLIYGIFKKEK